MKYKIVFVDNFVFDHLDGSIKKQIQKFLNREQLQRNPRSFGKALQYSLRLFWRYRVGNYRIIAEIQDNQLIILIIKIEKRDTVYD